MVSAACNAESDDLRNCGSVIVSQQHDMPAIAHPSAAHSSSAQQTAVAILRPGSAEVDESLGAGARTFAALGVGSIHGAAPCKLQLCSWRSASSQLPSPLISTARATPGVRNPHFCQATTCGSGAFAHRPSKAS